MAATDMSPKAGKPLVENDAGSYLAWSGKDQPAVAGEKLGCGLLVLKPLGFALPHYADSGKFGYVLGGSAVVGVLPAGVDARERVVRLEAGDVIAMRAGEVTWWYNDTDGEDVTIVFMGDTAGAVSPGDISYFVLAGPMGVLGGLDAGLLAKASGLTSPEQAATAFRSQPAALLTRLNGKLHGVRPREHDRHGLVVNAARVPADSNTGGAAAGTKTVTAAHLPVLAQLGFSVGLTRLDAGAAVRGPWVLRDAAAQAVRRQGERARPGRRRRRRVDAARRGGRGGEPARRAPVRRVARGRGRRRRHGAGVADQKPQAGDGALHREGIGDRRPDGGDRAGGAQRVAGICGTAQDQVLNAGFDESGTVRPCVLSSLYVFCFQHATKLIRQWLLLRCSVLTRE